jgi:RNA-binding protein
MSRLTGKQNRRLRSLGQRLAAAAAIGKAGLTDAVIANLNALLARHELVKVRLGDAGPADRDALVAQLEQATGAQCAGQIGRTALLYRPNPGLTDKRRVDLGDACL